MNELDEIWDKTRPNRSPPAPLYLAALANQPKNLPSKVYSCFCRVLFFNETWEAGVLELAGSNGEKAYCCFFSKVILTCPVTAFLYHYLLAACNDKIPKKDVGSTRGRQDYEGKNISDGKYFLFFKRGKI